ncbi:hypothetical protein [Cylindrospermum stagnale]|uniref:hypothetical protein n=1 Tax=Cylindrospermum stagnale TaxID=142864 RepID=UPI00031784A1|nr:hypothetical protein [Cylindrospermum stagnale]
MIFQTFSDDEMRSPTVGRSPSLIWHHRTDTKTPGNDSSSKLQQFSFIQRRCMQRLYLLSFIYLKMSVNWNYL